MSLRPYSRSIEFDEVYMGRTLYSRLSAAVSSHYSTVDRDEVQVQTTLEVVGQRFQYTVPDLEMQIVSGAIPMK